jgi:hypothetical protein
MRLKQQYILGSAAMVLASLRHKISRRRFIGLGAAGVAGLSGLGGNVLGLWQPPTAKAANPIQTENALPGTDNWNLYSDLSNNKSRDIEKDVCGFASATSVNKGEAVDLFVHVATPQNIRMQAYRMGYYGGLGGREMPTLTINGGNVNSPATLAAISQPAPAYDAALGLVSCHNWTKICTLTVPNSWTSGVYLIKLSCTQAVSGQTYASYIHLVVRDDAYNSDLYFQCSVTTYQAYNAWAWSGVMIDTGGGNIIGKSLYNYNSNGTRAYKVSFDRPYWDGGQGDFLYFEYHMVYWLEKEGYDVGYCTNIDTHSRPALLLNHKGFLSVGHDEYYSKAMYDHLVMARDLGLNLAFLSANSVYWQIRLENNALGTSNRVITCYKATGNVNNGEERWLDPVWAAIYPDPDNQPAESAYAAGSFPTLTTTFRDKPVNRPENTLIGIMFDGLNSFNSAYDFKFNGGSNVAHWFWTGVGVTNGQVTGVTAASNLGKIVGYEWDSNVPSSGTRPSGWTKLSESAVTPSNPDKYSNLSHSGIYTAAGGALVYASGTIEWNYGLAFDPNVGIVQTPSGSRVKAEVQKATHNLLRRFINNSPAATTLPRLNALNVKLANDTGEYYKAGTLSCALRFVLPGETISFDDVPQSGGFRTINVSGKLRQVPAAVTLNGTDCTTAPAVRLKAVAPLTTDPTANGLVFVGGGTLTNVEIRGFGGRQIVAQSGVKVNVNCSKAIKAPVP